MTNLAADEIQQIGVTVINSAGTRAANALMVSTQKHLVVLAKELNLTELAKHRNNMESPEDDGWD